VSERVATRVYVLAFVIGLIALAVTFWAMPAVCSIWLEGPSVKVDVERERLIIVILEVLVGGAIYAGLGAVLGYIWPKGGWRWGLWVSLPLIIFIAFYPIYIVRVLLLKPSEIFRFLIGTTPFTAPIVLACIGAGLLSKHTSKEGRVDKD